MRNRRPKTRTTAKPLRLGFVPLCDCAPLVMAQELGFFEKHGVRVQLSREVGWATVRDKLIYGELDAAHAVAGMSFAATFGLGSAPCPCVTGMVLSLQGNAITLSQKLWEDGVRDGKSLQEMVIRLRGRRTFTFGVVYPFSSHNFLLRQWLAETGIHPDRDVRIVVVPPPQMFANLKAGNLDGYCVGEPWNSVAVHNRIGWCVATSAQLAPGHPEKILLAHRRFAEERPGEHLALIAALLEGCAYCDQLGNADHLIHTLSRRQYLNMRAGLLGAGLRGVFDFGNGRVESRPDFHIFHRHNANEPSPDKADWIIRFMLKSGLLTDRSLAQTEAATQVFRPDIFHQAQQLLGRSHADDQSNPAETKLVNA